MKSKVLTLFVSGAICVGAVPSYAQNSNQGELTLDEAVARALATTPAVEGAVKYQHPDGPGHNQGLRHGRRNIGFRGHSRASGQE